MFNKIKASQEIIEILAKEKKDLACAVIEIDQDVKEWGERWFTEWFANPISPSKGKSLVNLKLGFSEHDFEEFLKKLDFEYDNGFGCQIIFGVLWCTDSTWYERNGYDGSERWVLKQRPEIPKFLVPPFDILKRGE